MKKLTLISIALTLLLATGFSTVASATTAAGAACSKLGVTQIVSSKKFTCIKSGSKLVWDKGVAVKPAPAATAPVISLDNLDPSWTLKVALAKVIEKYKSEPQSALKPELIASPTTLASESTLEGKLLIPVMQIFQDYFSPAKFQVIMFTNKDSTWADNAITEYGGNFPFKLSDEIVKGSTGGKYCNFAFATKGKDGVPIYFDCTDTRKARDWANYQNPPHEYFHLVQAALAGVPIPSWLLEGSAAFFGEAIGYRDLKSPIDSKKAQNINTGHDFDPDNQGFDPNRFVNWMKTASPTAVSKVYKYLESTNVPNLEGNKHAYYSLGSIATEALVASFGVDGFMKIFSELKTGKTFADAFKTSYGITPDEFYVKLAHYLNKR